MSSNCTAIYPLSYTAFSPVDVMLILFYLKLVLSNLVLCAHNVILYIRSDEDIRIC